MDNIQNKESQPLLVSIRCLAYNHEKYIRETLEGFVMQKTNFRFEAIVHDDASVDGTAEIVREYAEKYPDIIKPIYEIENQYSKKDGSLSRIMHEACKGKYIAMCEGDDYWTDPYKLQKQVDFLETHPGYVICSHYYKVHHCEGNIIDYVLPYGLSTSLNYDFNSFIKREYWFTQPLTCMYLRSAFDLEKYSEYKNSKDVTLFYMLLNKGKGFLMSDVMAVYRIHNGGVWSGSSSEKQLLDDIKTMKGIYDVELSYDAARAIRFFLIKNCYKFTFNFICSNINILLSIWRILFKYFGVSTFILILHEFHIKEKFLLWKKL